MANVGRPSEYRNDFAEKCRAFMGQGFSLTAFAGHIGVNRDTVVDWQKKFPEFSVAVKDGQAARTMYLEQGLLENEIGPKITARIFALKNADPEGWRDRHEVSGPDGGPLQVVVQKFTEGDT